MTVQSGFATFYDPGGNLGACETPIPDDFPGVAVSPKAVTKSAKREGEICYASYCLDV